MGRLSPRRVWTAVLLLAFVGGCSCSGTTGTTGGACEVDPPLEGCGTSCGTPGDPNCPGGLYCSSAGVCTADCSAAVPCPEGRVCTGGGRCIELLRDGGRPSLDGTNVCADVSVQAARVTPKVILIVDQSSSMTADFGGSGSRWNVLRNFLLQRPGGLIASLESQVEFGLTLYSARSRDGGGGGPPIGECPLLTSVLPAPNNYSAIEAIYRPADVIEDTPTGDAIDAVLDSILAVPDPDDDPVIFIVATDGEPDRCEELDPQRGQAEAVAAAERAFRSGVRTFMISVGDEVSLGHMQDMANAGLGVGPGEPDAPYWVVGDDASLRAALEAIVGGVLSCDLTLRGRIVDLAEACNGTVRLNDRVLPCDDPNGWRAVDETHIQILGSACDELTSNDRSRVEASFPCDDVIVF